MMLLSRLRALLDDDDACACQTNDRAPDDAPHQRVRVYTNEQLSPRQELTPEGFLLCRDVPIARTGVQVYGQHELPTLAADANGLIHVHRMPDDVFDESAVLSFAGKPVTNDHPPQRVTPETWRSHAVGVVLNPRRGNGGGEYDNSFLFADLLLHDRAAIRAVQAGKREVSAGYDAEYVQDGPGKARQSQIIGNHVALVEKGRCGFHCAIGDAEMTMAASTRDAIKRFFAAKDAVVEQLEKNPDMLGKILSGDAGDFAEEGTTVPTHNDRVSIHVHAPGGGGGGGAVHDEPDPVGAGPAPGGGGAPGGDPIQEVLARLEAIEQAIVLLAQGDEQESDPGDFPEEEAGGDALTGDRRNRTRDARNRVRDQDGAGEPETDEPVQRPPLNRPEDDDGPSEEPKKNAENVHVTDRRRANGGRRFVGDSSSLQLEWHETVARAEMITPGLKLPTFDSAKPAKFTVDALCNFRRGALDQAVRGNGSGREYVMSVLGDSSADFRSMTCDGVKAVFNGASELARRDNSHRVGSSTVANRGGGFGTTATVSDINAANRKFWVKQGGLVDR